MRFRWLKRMIAWSLVGISIQIPAYYVLDYQVQRVMNPSSLSRQVQTQAQANHYTLDTPNIHNPLVSFDDHFLAFRSGSELSIYDFSKQSVIWKLDQGKTVLAYQWLPDRNALLIFESGIGVNPALPGKLGVGIHRLEVSGNQGEAVDSFTTALPLSFQRTQISNISLSTATNLLYFSVQGQNQSNLYEIDVMKNLKRLNRSGEQVEYLAVSPVKGTVYYNLRESSNGQTLAENGPTRVQVASNPHDKVLGLWNQKLYLGTVDQGYLKKIWTLSDNQPSPKRPDFKLFWEGKVPWDQSSVVSNMAVYGLLVRTEKAVYQVSPQGSKVLEKGKNSFFSPSGKYYYAFSTDSTGTNLKRVVL